MRATGITLPDTELIMRIRRSRSLHRSAFSLRDAVVEEIRKHGGHAKHGNTIWDEEIVAATSLSSTLARESVALVTGEHRLSGAAAMAGAADRVYTLEAYEAALGL